MNIFKVIVSLCSKFGIILITFDKNLVNINSLYDIFCNSKLSLR